MKCPQCGYEWKIQRKPSVIARVTRSVALKEARAEPGSEAKEGGEPSSEKSEERVPAPAMEAAVDEEETVGLGWLQYWVDQGVVMWAI